MMNVPVISEMLRLFHEGIERYQPSLSGFNLEEETGDPGKSSRNLAKLLEGHRLVGSITVHKGDRALVLFNTGEAYLALGFGLVSPEKREAVTRFAAKIGYGEYERLKSFYDAIPDDYDSQLPPVRTDDPMDEPMGDVLVKSQDRRLVK